jgi:uncharacterized membrane protein YkoI
MAFTNFEGLVFKDGINSIQAKEIAIRFLEQHLSLRKVDKVKLKSNIWTVIVSLSNNKKRKVRIDAKIGKIIDWAQ